MKTLQIQLQGKPLKVPGSTSILALVAAETDPGLGLKRPIGALVDNRLASLDSTLYEGAKVEMVAIESKDGMEIYRRGCTLLLLEAARRLFPDVRLVVGQSLGNGYFFDWNGTPSMAPEHLKAIEQEMSKIADSDAPFEQERCGVQEAVRRFRLLGLTDRVDLLETYWHQTIRLVHFGGTTDLLHGPVPPSAGYLTHFGLAPYPPGFVLRFPDPRCTEPLDCAPADQTKLFTTHRQGKEWNRTLGVENVGQLNRLCTHGGIRDVIRVSEGFHEKRIAEIADTIVSNRDRIRIILIAGPSGSGKTTFLKRLSVQLRVLGLKPVGLSIDNYYVNREQTPIDEEGEYDFESIDALDLPLLNSHLVNLLAGNEVSTPRFSFATGQRQPEDRWVKMRLSPEDVLIMEGIHGLNYRLTSQIPAGNKYKIYVSALTQLCLDDANRIHTTDARLMRRIVRDRLYRGYRTIDTLRLWPSVSRGEFRDMFNSALVYETAVLKVYVERFLLEVTQDFAGYPEVHRLMKFLSLFVGIFPDSVPQNSILREFIGGSTFTY
jgi:uridine kinase